MLAQYRTHVDAVSPTHQLTAAHCDVGFDNAHSRVYMAIYNLEIQLV